MSDGRNRPVAVVIPAWNEEAAIGRVIGDLPRDLVGIVVVADNNSTDRTAEVARAAGAVVVPAPRQGYGSACLAALDYLRTERARRSEFSDRHSPPPISDLRSPISDDRRIIVFIDADYSDDPTELPRLVRPILDGQADFVIGSRMLTPQPPGALLPQAVWGNRLACLLMRMLFGVKHSDLGPFRAITWDALNLLDMSDPDYGWTIEMQIKAARFGLRTLEVPVSYRPRIGTSKITGTLRGTVLAGAKILWTIFRYCRRRGRSARPRGGGAIDLPSAASATTARAARKAVGM